jgi:hypothetical protein
LACDKFALMSRVSCLSMCVSSTDNTTHTRQFKFEVTTGAWPTLKYLSEHSYIPYKWSGVKRKTTPATANQMK